MPESRAETTTASGLEKSRARTAWLFLAPTLAALLLVALWPLLHTLLYSFTDATLSNLSAYRFIGFDNYLQRLDGEWVGLLTDDGWWRAVRNTVFFTVVSVTLETVVGMVIALVLNLSFPGRGMVRAAVLIPWAVPTIVSTKMWSWMMNDQFGVINHALMALGLLSEPLAWTSDPDLMMASVLMVDVWKAAPFMALLILAALQMLPSDCYEAARVDGVHPVKVFFKVTLPLIRPALMVAVIFRAMDALRVFDLIYVLTSNNIKTMTMAIYVRQQLVEFQMTGYGSAASMLLFMIIAGCIAMTIALGRVRFDAE
ncbi:sugar ABC transporter permease [Herbaspirillum sp. HC18]|nr:sugar ABC transporter permease [Herbaspirillum sp. HC18]